MNTSRSYLLLIIAFVAWFPPQDKWSQADSATVRLMPARFRALPAVIVRDLERRQCRIPQVSEHLVDSFPVNVIRGSFLVPRRDEWALLCSVRDSSRVLIYRADSGIPIDSLAKAADRHSLQGIGGDRIGYSRMITTASPEHLRRHAKPVAIPLPPQFDHDGIEDRFVGKASVLRYFQRGRWLLFLGAD